MPERRLNRQDPEGAVTSTDRRWLLKYDERIYGPYTRAAMESYIAEGRVAARSIVAPEGTLPGADTWREAAATAEFASFFQGIPVAVTPRAEAQPAASKTDAAAPAAVAARRTEFGPEKGQIDRRRQPETSNFIIVIDVKARYAGPLEQAIMSLGPAYKLAPNVWCVNAEATAPGLLNSLSQHIGKTDSMFIVDATRDRSVWLNIGPESEAKIRRVWRRAL